MHRHSHLLAILGALLVLGCDSDGSPPVAVCCIDESSRVSELSQTLGEFTMADCYFVRDALEAFAAENGGEYPAGIHDQSAAGNQFIEFLGGSLLINHRTKRRTEPVFHDPQWPGQIGVVLLSESSTPRVGYRVVARGRQGELLRLENVAQNSQQTVESYDSLLQACNVVTAAANEFARQEGRYAANLSSATSIGGETIVDFLPDGSLLMNPFSGIRDTPADGPPMLPGHIGYMGEDRDGNGSIDGYLIEAVGPDSVTVCSRRRESQIPLMRSPERPVENSP